MGYNINFTKKLNNLSDSIKKSCETVFLSCDKEQKNPEEQPGFKMEPGFEGPKPEHEKKPGPKRGRQPSSE